MTRKLIYKGIEVNSFGIPKFVLPKKQPESKWTKRIFNETFSSDLNEHSPKNLIVIYDIPEPKKKERDWFRRHLKKFNYVMIQRSVWVGPSPLPKDFLKYVKSIGLENQLKTFKLAREYSDNDNFIK